MDPAIWAAFIGAGAVIAAALIARSWSRGRAGRQGIAGRAGDARHPMRRDPVVVRVVVGKQLRHLAVRGHVEDGKVAGLVAAGIEFQGVAGHVGVVRPVDPGGQIAGPGRHLQLDQQLLLGRELARLGHSRTGGQRQRGRDQHGHSRPARNIGFS